MVERSTMRIPEFGMADVLAERAERDGWDRHHDATTKELLPSLR